MLFNDRRTIKNPAVAAAAKAGSIKATKKAPSALSQKIAGAMMGTGSSKSKTVKANRAAIDTEMKKGY